MAAQAHNILALVDDGPVDLVKAAYLGEYSGIILDASSVAFADELPPVVPPIDIPIRDVGHYRSLMVEQRRREEQADGFFRAGGVLVVRLQPETELSYGDRGYAEFDSFLISNWWRSKIQPDWLTGTAPGVGQSIEVTEPDHPFAPVISTATEYTARFTQNLDGRDDIAVLAKNRSGYAIAAEFDCSHGKIICVPAGCDTGLLELALRAYLDDAHGTDAEIRLPEEDEIEKAIDTVDHEHRTARLSLTEKRQAVRDVKSGVLGNIHVKRARSYVKAAKTVGANPTAIMTSLYKMVEMLEDYFNSGEQGLPKALDVDMALIKRIKRLANKKELDIRHATSGEPDGADAVEFDQAIVDGDAILNAFVHVLYREALITARNQTE